jgi:hypothetical protein
VAGAGLSTKIRRGEEEKVIRQKNTHKFKFLPWRGNIFPVLEREKKVPQSAGGIYNLRKEWPLPPSLLLSSAQS